MYRIVESYKGKVEETCFTATRKREIIKIFNLYMRNLKKDGHFVIEKVREGFARYTFVGSEGGRLYGEFYVVSEA